jgi:hypothetical protein
MPPFGDIVDPEQLTALAAVLNEYCRVAGIDKNGPAGQEAAQLIIALFSSGATTSGQLRAALAAVVPPERKKPIP